MTKIRLSTDMASMIFYFEKKFVDPEYLIEDMDNLVGCRHISVP